MWGRLTRISHNHSCLRLALNGVSFPLFWVFQERDRGRYENNINSDWQMP